MNKIISISIIIVALIIGGVIFFGSPKNTGTVPEPGIEVVSQNSDTASDNVKIVDGIQIIELRAKGGYTPGRSTAQAGIPTIIRFETNGTFDCSLSVRIPSLRISKFLQQTGITDINIGIPSVGLFRGSCGMGMYLFEIDFI